MAKARGEKVPTNYVRWRIAAVYDESGNVIKPHQWVVNAPGVIDRPDGPVDRFAENLGPFEPEADYVMNVWVPFLDGRLDIDRKGHQIAAAGMERSPDAPLADIGKLPTFYKASA